MIGRALTIPQDKLVIFDRRIALQCVGWISPEFEVWCYEKIEELVTRGYTTIHDYQDLSDFELANQALKLFSPPRGQMAFAAPMRRAAASNAREGIWPRRGPETRSSARWAPGKIPGRTSDSFLPPCLLKST